METFTFSHLACRNELVEFQQLLQTEDLSEQSDILPFFKGHKHLAALVGTLNTSIGRIDRLGFEYDIFGDFRCDLIVGDTTELAYCLVEFEDARRDSIFCLGQKYQEEWSYRFERGYSQVVDWFWKISDLERTDDAAKRFGSGATFSGMLVIGRNRYIDEHSRKRLDWRATNVVVNSEKIMCLTFDDLYNKLLKRLNSLEELARESS